MPKTVAAAKLALPLIPLPGPSPRKRGEGPGRGMRGEAAAQDAAASDQWFIALTMSSVIFLASPSSIIVPSL